MPYVFRIHVAAARQLPSIRKSRLLHADVIIARVARQRKHACKRSHILYTPDGFPHLQRNRSSQICADLLAGCTRQTVSTSQTATRRGCKSYRPRVFGAILSSRPTRKALRGRCPLASWGPVGLTWTGPVDSRSCTICSAAKSTRPSSDLDHHAI